MTPEERVQYIDLGMRFCNIEVHPQVLKKLLKIVDLVDKKKGNANIKDLIEIKHEKNE